MILCIVIRICLIIDAATLLVLSYGHFRQPQAFKQTDRRERENKRREIYAKQAAICQLRAKKTIVIKGWMDG